MAETNHELLQYIREDLKSLKEKVDLHIRSHSQDRETLRIYLDEKYVREEEFAPIRKFYNRLVDFALGFIILVGAVAIGVFMWVKQKMVPR